MEEKIATAFRRIICRKPTDREKQILDELYKEQLQLFEQKKLDAGTTLKVGEYPLDKKANKNQLAALMKVVSTIYNMEEAIVKG